MKETGEIYWLASRRAVSNASNCSFGVRIINTSGELNSVNSCRLMSEDRATGVFDTLGIRPCISLRSDVKVIGGGDGSEESQAYELGI